MRPDGESFPEALRAAIVARAAALRPAGLAGWGADPRTGTVEVRTQGTGDAFTAWAAALSPAVRIVTNVPAQRQQAGSIRGGDKWIPGTEGACSIGFSATGNGGGRHFLTAGHCTNDVNQAAYGKDGTAVGTSNSGGTHSVNSREGDFGLVDVTASGWTLSPVVYAWGTATDVTVTGSTEPVTGMSVCRSGQTSGWRCGRVTAVDQSIDYGNVIIDGLFTTDACSQGGDSGGSYVTGTLAVGLHSGGGNPCGQSNPNTTAQPVNEALAKWGLTLTTSGGNPSPTPSSPSPSTPPTGDRTFSNDTDFAILDNQRIYSPVTSTATGAAASPARVTVTIRHSCAEDVGISLVSPNGTIYAVKYSGGYSCTPISAPAGYQVLVSGPAAGRWQLRVTDYGYGDTGTLDRWSITL
ncbi:proprotein convertase P-domain-containing protein [Dactylosporangium sp. NPDC049742]|uniref:proprotein convertase P-domain-containing protein n=1 Tax=Dactylosporangium sp. NPDC049742 TaxID=3154737 RepID=UPI003425A6C2